MPEETVELLVLATEMRARAEEVLAPSRGLPRRAGSGNDGWNCGALREISAAARKGGRLQDL